MTKDRIPLPVNLAKLIAEAQQELTPYDDIGELIVERRSQITSKYVRLNTRPTDDFNDYLTDGSHDYDPDEVYTRSTNKFDHSQTVHTPHQRQIVAAMNQIVASGVVPEYRTVHDFVRNAVVHQLHRDMAKMSAGSQAELNSILSVERMVAWLDQQEAEIASLDKLTEHYIARIEKFIDKRQWTALEALIPKAEAVAENIGGEWGEAIEGACEKANRHLGREGR